MINIDSIIIDAILTIISIAIMIILVFRTKGLYSISISPSKITATIESYDSAIYELTTLRLKRDGLKMIISKAYEEFSKGVIDEETKNKIVTEISKQLSEIESRIIYLEKFEELNRLIKERRRVEDEYKRKISELDKKIEYLQRIVRQPTKKEKPTEKKVEEEKVKKVTKKKEKRTKKLTELMDEIMKILEESK